MDLGSVLALEYAPGSTPHANAIELISEDESAAAAHHQSLPVNVLSLVVDRACSTQRS
jgi:hypothetical protein